MVINNNKVNKYYKSFEQLYTDVHKLLYSFAFDHVVRLEDADEITSMVWAKIAENPAYYLDMDKEHLKNYMRVMVKNFSINYSKKKDRQQQAEEIAHNLLYPYPETIYIKDDSIMRQDIHYLTKAIEILTIEEKTLLIWNFEKNMPARETAIILNISEGAVRVRQHRILGKLKKEIMRLKKEE